MFVDVRDNIHVTKFDEFNVKKSNISYQLEQLLSKYNVNEIIRKIIRYIKYNLCYESFYVCQTIADIFDYLVSNAYLLIFIS